MFNRNTEKARRVIFFARYEASQFGSPCIDTEHLLLGLLREDKYIAIRLSRPDFFFEKVRGWIEEHKRPLEKISTSIDLPLSEASKRVLRYAVEKAERLEDKQIGTNHLLLALLREEDGLAAKILEKSGIKAAAARYEMSLMSDSSRKIAEPQKRNLEDYIEIHGELWGANSVRELAEYHRKFHWEKCQWTARDALRYRTDSTLHLYYGQTYDPDKAELLQGGWSEDHCAICWWKLTTSDSPDRSEGYTNGQDWLCTECYNRFIDPPQPGAPEA
jgi:hypothetical protein